MATKTTKNSMRWFRKGLRLHDNPALELAASKAEQLYPVYILDGDCYQLKHCSVNRAKFLIDCLKDLDESLRKRNSRLLVDSGDPTVILPKLWKELDIDLMTFEEDETGEPYALARDSRVRELAKDHGVQIRSVASETLRPLARYMDETHDLPPATMGGFQKLFHKLGKLPSPIEPMGELPGMKHLDSIAYAVPKSPLALPWPRDTSKADVTPLWGPEDVRKIKSSIVQGGETEALQRLEKYVSKRPRYVANFEKPKTSCTEVEDWSTTVLSPYLSLGCLSPRTFWHAIESATAGQKTTQPPVSLHGQLLWRDFNNLMAHSANKSEPGSWGRMQGNKYCRQIPWKYNSAYLDAWKNGKTGYPWIDACMNQLREMGWIHHLGRHAVACFLTRGDLWVSWEEGAEIFEGYLLDADYGINNFNWLWLSCSGFFYQYFRCYSPIAFQKKKDPTGVYIRRFVPQLRKLPDKYIYEPWKAPKDVLARAGVHLGENYPNPIVEHSSISKENMSAMKMAYDLHKSSNANSKKGASKGSSSTTTSKGQKRKSSVEPKTKRSMKQKTLKF